MAEPHSWYVDSSVVLHAIVDQSTAARKWLERRIATGDNLIASRFMELEVRRVAKNVGVETEVVQAYIDEFMLMALDDDIVSEAIALDEKLGGADSIHVASALRVGQLALTLVTHDKQMATAAAALGFAVVDPVNDDPGHSAVA